MQKTMYPEADEAYDDRDDDSELEDIDEGAYDGAGFDPTVDNLELEEEEP